MSHPSEIRDKYSKIFFIRLASRPENGIWKEGFFPYFFLHFVSRSQKSFVLVQGLKIQMSLKFHFFQSLPLAIFLPIFVNIFSLQKITCFQRNNPQWKWIRDLKFWCLIVGGKRFFEGKHRFYVINKVHVWIWTISKKTNYIFAFQKKSSKKYAFSKRLKVTVF